MVVSNDSLGNGLPDGVNLGDITTSSDGDSDVKVLDSLETQEENDAGSSNSMGDPLTLRTPIPFLTVALATAFFFLPKHWTNWFLV